MTLKEAKIFLLQLHTDKQLNKSEHEALRLAIKALEQEPVIDKIRAEIEMYEADCRLQGGTDECGKCNSNVFGSIYRIIDKAERGDKE